MTIDKAKLIELLVKKTGLSDEEVEEQLSHLVKRIYQAAEQGKNFQIEGFGTFSIKDDNLHFEPSAALETEINYKYAGMKPIELIGAFKETPLVEEEVTEKPAAVPPGPDEKEEEPQVEALENKENEATDIHKEPAVEETRAEAQTEEGTVDKIDHKASFEFDAEGAGGEEKAPQEPVAEEPVAAGSAEPETQGKDPIGLIVSVCVVILLVGVAGWIAYDSGLFSTSEPGAEAVLQTQPSADREEPGVEVSSDMASDPDTEPTGESEPADQPPPADDEQSIVQEEGNTTPPSSVYGLMGTVNPEGNNGYTIVVHSLGSRNKAQNRLDALAADGYRTVLSSAVINGQTFWRVGLGQFETVDDAQKAAEKLPDTYRNNYFIKRIQ